MPKQDHTNFEKTRSQKTIYIYIENEMSGLINPSFDGLTYYMCGRFHFPFSTLTSSSSKNFFKCTTFKFWKLITVYILEVKESGYASAGPKSKTPI